VANALLQDLRPHVTKAMFSGQGESPYRRW